MKITLDKLSAGYDGKRLFSDISAELQPGKPHFLAGPNGGGKSTLLKLMCNYLPPVSGTVLLDDKPIGKYSFAERARRLGVVWQSVRPGLDFSVLDMAAVIASARFPRLGKLPAGDKELIYSSLERFGLLDKAQHRFSTLSGGEAQRLLLAGMMVLAPDVMLLDEPTSALDPAWRNRVFEFLEEYACNHTVLIVTHDLELIGRAGGTLWLLDRAGNFISGRADALLNSETLSRVYACNASVIKAPGRPTRIYFD